MHQLLFLLLIFTGLLSCQDTQPPASDDNAVIISTEAIPPVAAPPASMINPNGTTIAMRINPPDGFRRVESEPGTFGHFLSHFPVKKDGLPVLLYDGSPKNRQDVHAAILDIDVGTRDLQQCADAVMRLRAEYLWSQNRYSDIHFNFTNGFKADYQKWRNNHRIRVQGNKVSWVATTKESESYSSFRQYLTMVFSYAGTHSLANELKKQELKNIQIGDVIIKGGFPGHAVLVVDKAVHPVSGEILILLAQSYMPAQDIHVIKNLHHPDLSPWYATDDFTNGIQTAEWSFSVNDIKRFEE